LKKPFYRRPVGKVLPDMAIADNAPLVDDKGGGTRHSFLGMKHAKEVDDPAFDVGNQPKANAKLP